MNMMPSERCASLPPSVPWRNGPAKRLSFSQPSRHHYGSHTQPDQIENCSSPTSSPHCVSCSSPNATAGSSEIPDSNPPPADPTVSLGGEHQESISHRHVCWFWELPDKVRKQHFSREEQLAWTTHCCRAPGPASSPDRFPNPPLRRRSVHLPQFRAPPARPGNSASSAEDRGHTKTSGSATDDRSVVRSQSKTSNLTPMIADAIASTNIIRPRSSWRKENLVTRQSDSNCELSVFRRLLQPKGHEKTKKTSHEGRQSSPTSLANAKVVRKGKCSHRKLHLTPLSLPPPVLAPATTPAPFIAPIVPPKRIHFEGMMVHRLSRPFVDSDPLVLDGHEGEYFDDGGAFERDDHHAAPWSGWIKSSEDSVSAGLEDIPVSATSIEMLPLQRPESVTSDDESDFGDTDTVDTMGPQTPPATSDGHRAAVIKQPSADSIMGLPLQFHQCNTTAPAIYEPCEASRREEDLRRTNPEPPRICWASDDILSSLPRPPTPMGDSDPLALESLTVCDDPTGAHGAFAPSPDAFPKGLRRVFRKGIHLRKL